MILAAATAQTAHPNTIVNELQACPGCSGQGRGRELITVNRVYALKEVRDVRGLSCLILSRPAFIDLRPERFSPARILVGTAPHRHGSNMIRACLIED
jgi:hypothetical protein